MGVQCVRGGAEAGGDGSHPYSGHSGLRWQLLPCLAQPLCGGCQGRETPQGWPRLAGMRVKHYCYHHCEWWLVARLGSRQTWCCSHQAMCMLCILWMLHMETRHHGLCTCCWWQLRLLCCLHFLAGCMACKFLKVTAQSHVERLPADSSSIVASMSSNHLSAH